VVGERLTDKARGWNEWRTRKRGTCPRRESEKNASKNSGPCGDTQVNQTDLLGRTTGEKRGTIPGGGSRTISPPWCGIRKKKTEQNLTWLVGRFPPVGRFRPADPAESRGKGREFAERCQPKKLTVHLCEERPPLERTLKGRLGEETTSRIARLPKS